MNGIRIRFETKPGKSRASAGVLPSSSRERDDRVRPSRRTSRSPRITSTSFSTGTGLKKCMPITRSGRDVAAASDVIGIDDVFDARIASGGSTRVGARGRCPASRPRPRRPPRSSGRRRRARRPALTRASTSSGSRAALLRELRRGSCASPRAPRSTAPGRGVVQRHAPPGRRDDLRDAAAHLPRADDENVLEAHPARLAVTLRPRGASSRRSRAGRSTPARSPGRPRARVSARPSSRTSTYAQLGEVVHGELPQLRQEVVVREAADAEVRRPQLAVVDEDADAVVDQLRHVRVEPREHHERVRCENRDGARRRRSTND